MNWNMALAAGTAAVVMAHPAGAAHQSTDDGGDWVTVAAGWYHACGIQIEGTLWCWGRGTSGQLGTGTPDDHASAVQIGVGTRWSSVSAGGYHTCALSLTGELWCWGENFDGVLGDGTHTRRLSPVQVSTAAGAAWRQVATTSNTTCAVDAGGRLWCWGLMPVYPHEPDGGMSGYQRATPQQVGIDHDWASVDVDSGISPMSATYCAVKTNGTLWCWGDNTAGQVGDGTTSDRAAPVQVGRGQEWAQVSVDDVVCGITSDHTLWCWGGNRFGQVGDGTVRQRRSPTRAGDASARWSSVSAGGAYTCAVHVDRTLWCWGRNTNGARGDLGTEDRLVPGRIDSDAAWVVVDTHDDNTCAVTVDGTVRCWGAAWK